MDERTPTDERTISIPEEVYHRLEEERCEGETIGDVVARLVAQRHLDGAWGAWSDETADRAREAVRDGRNRSERPPSSQ